MQATISSNHKVVSQDEWLAARKAHLAEEKALTRQRDELAQKRRELPWVKVDKNYLFDGPDGKVSLADLFDGRSQLIVYHFMFDPAWSQGCKSCSFVADHYNPAIIHLGHRDVTMVTVSKAPIEKLEAFRKRIGWSFKWVSSFNNNFNRDFGVSFTEQELSSGDAVYNYVAKPYPITELPGISVFVKDEAGDIFHTYSSYARGAEQTGGSYYFLDLTALGRQEDWEEPKGRSDSARAAQPDFAS